MIMDHTNSSIKDLKVQISQTEKVLQGLKAQLAKYEADISLDKKFDKHNISERERHFSSDEYRRYGRQMIVPGIGIQGQLQLKSASVLIVGAGGLGCPAAAYLAGAGIGTIGLVDGDTVELSNLHRQILHDSSTLGMKKVESAIYFLKRLNPHLQYEAYPTPLTAQNAEDISSGYDLLLDCTDNPSSRYLISDISSLLQKPLISASAFRRDGQLMLLNWPPLPAGDQTGGPCYRCVFPKPPPVDSVTSCGEGGIIGPVVGVMGVLQAQEALRILTCGKLRNIDCGDHPDIEPSMLLFSASPTPQFRRVRLKGRRSNCTACSNESLLSLEKLRNGDLDYQLFCGMESTHITLLNAEERIGADQFAKEIDEGLEHLLLDVREKVQFDICNLPGSINIPISKLKSHFCQPFNQCEKQDWIPASLSPLAPIYVICRSGNDSQIVTRLLKESGLRRNVKDIVGGFNAWRKKVDPSWPEY